ncbi:integrase [Mesorhizobium sp. M4A.F.Ca.ET.020.02.1.1]|nr:integrase [Mesorhizobium sp. M4A.F.Ca.ET.020.02.1.1]RWC20056.1 MAG: integrase [Mesorhizobium sp.]
MPRTLEEAQVTTKAARLKLPKGTHWRAIDPDIHLGYRLAPRGGRWVVRWYVDGRYRQDTLGTADDVMDADGVECLSFSQATTAARSLVEIRRRESLAKAKGAPLTVRSAVDAYVEGREKVERARGGRFDTGNRMRKHVLSDAALADKEMHALTEADLQDWRGRLPDALARASVMRVNNDLKAALNAAASKHARHLRDLNASHIGVVIKNGLAAVDAVSPVARDKAILPDADIRRIVEASEAVDCEDEWGGDFARLVLVLAATGSRFSQVIRLTVADVQTSQSRLMIPVSHKGRGEKHTTRTAVPVGEEVFSALRPAVAGRRGGEILLLRPRWKQLTPTKWTMVGREPWKTPSELARPWKAVVAEAGLSADVPPYALRHSSIVRGLRSGLPVRLVAALHDTSSAMIEKHYSAYIVSALDELAARAVISLKSADVTPIRPAAAG